MLTCTLHNLNAGHLCLMVQGIYFFCDACMQEEERRQLEIAQRRAEHGLVWVWLLVVLHAWSWGLCEHVLCQLMYNTCQGCSVHYLTIILCTLFSRILTRQYKAQLRRKSQQIQEALVTVHSTNI